MTTYFCTLTKLHLDLEWNQSMLGRTSSVRMYETGPSKEWNRRSGHTIRKLWKPNCLKPPHDVSGHSGGNCVTESPMACLRSSEGLSGMSTQCSSRTGFAHTDRLHSPMWRLIIILFAPSGKTSSTDMLQS